MWETAGLVEYCGEANYGEGVVEAHAFRRENIASQDSIIFTQCK
jgi:hypothetical protein